MELTGEPPNENGNLKTVLIASSKSDDERNSDERRKQDFGNCMFSLTNSTLSLKSIHFSLIDTSEEGRQQTNEARTTKLAIVSSSMLTISESKIELSSWTSPILISPSTLEESGTSSSVVVQNSWMWSDVGEMRGLVETSAFADLGASVSVSIVGCSFDSTRIMEIDGIGLSLTLTPRKMNEENGRISSSLITTPSTFESEDVGMCCVADKFTFVGIDDSRREQRRLRFVLEFFLLLPPPLPQRRPPTRHSHSS
ncbi:hypothetical protein BLNAU_6597 [Blattamonas nauphoetae]|uniref:Uncharacterized protein n=1 Tax=Blattamonas nauphoetae TaxID=2049346 RepID=A0ABQ9Y3J2_9EUKA|nr:hypothetical protein BLNAU_6597 [Blattamonas nauphoetae]